LTSAVGRSRPALQSFARASPAHLVASAANEEFAIMPPGARVLTWRRWLRPALTLSRSSPWTRRPGTQPPPLTPPRARPQALPWPGRFGMDPDHWNVPGAGVFDHLYGATFAT